MEIINFKEGALKMNDKVVYEVLRVIDGKPLFLEDHLERMTKKCFKNILPIIK